MYGYLVFHMGEFLFLPFHGNKQDIKVDRGFSVVYVLTVGLCNLSEDAPHWSLCSYDAHFYHLSLFWSEMTDLRQEKDGSDH